MRTFIDDVLEGLAVFEDLDKYIEIWHTTEIPVHLYQYLGIRKTDQTSFAKGDDIIKYIIKNRKCRSTQGHIKVERG